MAVVRSLRRTSSITIILACLLAFGFFLFMFAPRSPAAATTKQREDDAAQSHLSPPTKAFIKNPSSDGEDHRAPPVVHYHLNNLTSSSDPIAKNERILILTPMARYYQEYWDNLVKLDYPHELVSLGFITPKTKEGDAATAALQDAVTVTQSGAIDGRFASVTILRQDFQPPFMSQDEKERHKLSNQKTRRESMGRARNSLLFATLGPTTSWVLWLDADIIETPATLIQDLAHHDRPIIVPNCYQRYYNTETKSMDVRPYDYNSWRDSDTALSLAAKMGPDEVLLEGYAEIPTYRSLMAFMADGSTPDKIVALDGVGGTALMVKAEVHRDGAMFPPFPFYHLLETEGFAKMARRLGYTCWGLPNYFVYHYNE